MKVLTLDEGFLVYQFDPPEGELEGLNFLVLVEDGKALFLDTGYRENMEEAVADLADRGAVPVSAIVSHYHPDHAGGLALLGVPEVWAGEGFRKTAEPWLRPGEAIAVEPTRIVSAPTELRFGKRRLEIFPLPGHSDDSLAVVVDGAWIYAADAILLTNDGRPVLPSVHSRPVSLHLQAVDWLAARTGLVFVPGHGAVMGEKSLRERDLANRRRYLAALAGAKGRVSLKEATAGCEPPFLGEAWHEENYL